MTERNEVSYYSEITHFIEMQLQSNFRAKNKNDIHIFWKIGEMKSRIEELMTEHPAECNCLKDFARKMPPLNVDIFAVITDGGKFELLILEVKLRKSAGLAQWSQLIGYCMVADCRYGLLVNIDGGASDRLIELLRQNIDVSKIIRMKNNNLIEALLGFMQWNSITKNFEYSGLGQLCSLSAISNELIKQFVK
ncbi:MAG: hypothetical protein LBR26_01995 [Prevotella sp.]|jgi:hypothetical protein|nr:hypothetical protein [Prevotella sp.]